ncbi:MAG: hypothetical protein H0U95_06590 [Bacteroidetes bacterium]|nr:hypothetical protein [Bacteroidota bacterium]
MQEKKTWEMLLRHLGGEDSKEEKETFAKWLNKSEKNKMLFCKVKILWFDENNIDQSFQQKASQTFLGRFTKQKIKDFVFKQAVGNLIGFTVGMWVTAMFSHHVLEKRGLKNLFGLSGRKKIAVNEIPEWLQSGIAILVGFITLELINHFFQTKKHLIVLGHIKKLYVRVISGNKTSEN